MQRQDKGAAAIERGLGAADFSHARQKGEDVALMRRQRLADHRRHRAGQVALCGDIAFRVLDGDREHPALALDHRRVHQRGQPRAVGGGGHRQQPQLRP